MSAAEGSQEVLEPAIDPAPGWWAELSSEPAFAQKIEYP